MIDMISLRLHSFFVFLFFLPFLKEYNRGRGSSMLERDGLELANEALRNHISLFHSHDFGLRDAQLVVDRGGPAGVGAGQGQIFHARGHGHLGRTSGGHHGRHVCGQRDGEMGPRVWDLCIGVGPRVATFARGLSSVPPMPAGREPLHPDRSSVGRVGPQKIPLATERPHPRPPRGARTRQLVRHSRLPQTPPHELPFVSPQTLVRNFSNDIFFLFKWLLGYHQHPIERGF